MADAYGTGGDQSSSVVSPRSIRTLTVAGTAILASLNVAFVAFFVLYSIADEWAVDRSEASHGSDPTMLLPHDAALWIVANASIVILLAFDGVWAAVLVRIYRTDRKATH